MSASSPKLPTQMRTMPSQHAPGIWVDDVSVIAASDGTIRLTLASIAWEHADTGVDPEAIIAGRFVLSEGLAKKLAAALIKRASRPVDARKAGEAAN